MVVVRVHDREDRPIDEDVPVIEQREVVQQHVAEDERLPRSHVEQVLQADGGDDVQQGEVEARAQVDEEVAAEICAVYLEAATPPAHDRREEAPEGTSGETPRPGAASRGR